MLELFFYVIFSGTFSMWPRAAGQANAAVQRDFPQENWKVGAGCVEGSREDIAGSHWAGERGRHAARDAAERSTGEKGVAVW